MAEIHIHFLGSERVFTTDRTRDYPSCVIAGQSAILDQLDGVWNLGFAGLDGEGATAQEAAADLEEKLKPLAKLLEQLIREPSKSLLHELLPDLDKEDEIQIPDGPLPAGIFLPTSDDNDEEQAPIASIPASEMQRAHSIIGGFEECIREGKPVAYLLPEVESWLAGASEWLAPLVEVEG